jgi:hypothetical protein
MGPGADAVVGVGCAGSVLEVIAEQFIHVAFVDFITVAFF